MKVMVLPVAAELAPVVVVRGNKKPPPFLERVL